MDATMISLDIPGILQKLTDVTGWQEAEGPESGVGVDYWFVADNAGTEIQAYLNLDQTSLTVTVNPVDGSEEPSWSLALDLEALDADYAGFVTTSAAGMTR